jgi:hypothetical protein
MHNFEGYSDKSIQTNGCFYITKQQLDPCDEFFDRPISSKGKNKKS